MYCSKCGIEISPDSKFCKNCGCQIESEISSPVIITETKPNKTTKKKINIFALVIGLVFLGISIFITANCYKAVNVSAVVESVSVNSNDKTKKDVKLAYVYFDETSAVQHETITVSSESTLKYLDKFDYTIFPNRKAPHTFLSITLLILSAAVIALSIKSKKKYLLLLCSLILVVSGFATYHCYQVKEVSAEVVDMSIPMQTGLGSSDKTDVTVRYSYDSNIYREDITYYGSDIIHTGDTIQCKVQPYKNKPFSYLYPILAVASAILLISCLLKKKKHEGNEKVQTTGIQSDAVNVINPTNSENAHQTTVLKVDDEKAPE